MKLLHGEKFSLPPPRFLWSFSVHSEAMQPSHTESCPMSAHGTNVRVHISFVCKHHEIKKNTGQLIIFTVSYEYVHIFLTLTTWYFQLRTKLNHELFMNMSKEYPERSVCDTKSSIQRDLSHHCSIKKFSDTIKKRKICIYIAFY